MILIKGFGLAGYRSFPSDRMSYLPNLSDVNLIVGQNNAGKSNVLRLIQAINGDEEGYGVLDRPSYDPVDEAPKGAEIAVAYDVEDLRNILGSYLGLDDLQENHETWIAALVSLIRRETDSELLWVHYRSVDKRGVLEVDSGWASRVGKSATSEESEVLKYAARGLLGSGASGVDSYFRAIVSTIFQGEASLRVETIDAFRQIRPEVDGSQIGSNDGIGLIAKLDALRAPDAELFADRDKFDSIQRFVQAVLDDPDLRIEIPSSRKTINIIQGGRKRPLPLENMGTGIHQVVILAAAATLLTKTLVCLEEPEIHLHPVLQRKFLHYLAKETTNQYLIATHSAHMLDSSLASIFHVSMTDGGSEVRPALSAQDRFNICADLGYRASDLVQANAIIWVEGPSDRIYLQCWLTHRASDLVEGIHFSIMFYGGRLLNHLSAKDPDVNEFISLKRLNRHVAILIDSDKHALGSTINLTKERVCHEISEGGGFAWVTSGYTIENYVPTEIFKKAVVATHPSARVEDYDKFDNPLGDKVVKGPVTLNKVAIARKVNDLSDGTTVWRFDLEERLSRLIDFIRSANETIVRQSR